MTTSPSGRRNTWSALAFLAAVTLSPLSASCSSGGTTPAAGGAGTNGGAGTSGGAGSSGGGAAGTTASGGAGTTGGGAGANGSAGGTSGGAGTAAAGTNGGAGATAAAGTTGNDGGPADASAEHGGDAAPTALSLTSTAFTPGGTIPTDYTCVGGTGARPSPPLAMMGVPAGAKGYAIVLKDMTNGFTHWAIWDIPLTTMTIANVDPTTHTPTEPPGAKQVGGDNESMGYIRPCPPSGSHTYVFTLYAQSALPLPGVTTAQFAADIQTQLDKQSANKPINNVGMTTLSALVTK